jgi:cell pole-organizing protein PopZ
MTQPAKVQEPSMEEILASIRRIIADDEAKPEVAEKPAAQAAAAPAKPAAMTDIPPSKIPAAQAAATKAPAKPAPPPPPPAPEVSNNQDDIDALLAGLDDVPAEPEIPPPAPAPEPEPEVFELTDEMAVPDAPQAPFSKIEPEDDLVFAENVAKAAVRKPMFEPPPLVESPAPPSQPILSRSTVSAVESAFNSLAHTVLSNNARTLEDLVKEMLRPMLKSWLDDNLPGLVERIVKAEIERVSRGR